MKRLCLISLILIGLYACNNEPAGAQVDLSKTPLLSEVELDPDYNLRALDFIDQQTGYACGYDGVIIKTMDGGSSWTKLSSNTSAALFSIDFIDKAKGFAVGEGSTMLRSLDSGQSWQRLPLNVAGNIEFRSLKFFNQSLGYAVGHSSIFRTRDGGNSWEETVIANLFGIMQEVTFADSARAMIVCSNGVVLTTGNGGNDWYRNLDFEVEGTVGISAMADGYALLFDNSTMQLTEDFGQSWLGLNDTPRDLFDLLLVNDDFGIAVGRGKYSGGDFGSYSGAIYHTGDRGVHWSLSDESGDFDVLHQCSFPSDTLGYIVGSHSVVKVEVR